MYLDLNYEVQTNGMFRDKLNTIYKEIARLENLAGEDPSINDKISEYIIEIYRLCKFNAGLLVPYFFPQYPYDKPLSCSARPYSYAMFHMQIGGFLAIRAGRQIGKSTSLSARQLIYAHIMHKRRSMYIVPHQSFLDTYANRVREMERAFRFYQVHKDFRQNLKYKEYPNESIIQMVKCLMDTQEARSKTTDEVLFDETVHMNTIVYTIEGGKIKERKISDILVGEKVIAYTNEGSIKEAYMRYNKNKGRKHTWKLIFSNGAELICTGNTRFWTSRGWMFLSEFLSWEEAKRGENVVKAKALLAIRAAATPGDSSWRLQNTMGCEICRIAIGDKLNKQTIKNCNTTALIEVGTFNIDNNYLNVHFYAHKGLSVISDTVASETKESSGLVPVTLESIEYAGQEEVWDIDVEEYHTFFANGIAIHNCQLLDPDFIPDIEQCQKASRMPTTIYAGTSTTTESLLETTYQASSQAAWLLKAPGYKSESAGHGWLNCADQNDVLKAMSPRGLINPATGSVIDVTHGHFVHQIQSRFEQGFLGFHIPQIIIPDYANNPAKWMEIWDAYNRYDIKKFLQEVLGIPTEEGMKEITINDLKRMCCLEESPETLHEMARQTNGRYKYVVGGCDWGGSDYNPASRTKVSYTVHVILGIRWDGYVDILHMRQYSGMDYRSIANQICDDHEKYRCIGLASDFGVGAAYNMLLRENPKINPARHIIFNYVGPQSSLIKPPASGGWMNQFSLNRTEAITTLYDAVKTGRIRCYNWNLAQDYLLEFLNLSRVPVESPGGVTLFRYQRHGSKADDTLHAVNFAFCLARIVLNEPLLEDPTIARTLQETFNPQAHNNFLNPYGSIEGMGGVISG